MLAYLQMRQVTANLVSDESFRGCDCESGALLTSLGEYPHLNKEAVFFPSRRQTRILCIRLSTAVGEHDTNAGALHERLRAAPPIRLHVRNSGVPSSAGRLVVSKAAVL
jgi:hypothetical protein